jgi:hypothetical protein
MGMSDVLFKLKEELNKVTDDHFLKYFFWNNPIHPLLISLAGSISAIDSVSVGYAEEMIKRIVSLSGKSEDTLENILSIFSEILVSKHAVDIADEINGKKYFVPEPGLREGRKNPEFRSILNDKPYCVEVKKPRLIKHANTRFNPVHIPARSSITSAFTGEQLTLPRDNPIKDFLKSAQEKFEDYITEYPDDYRFLFIMWDDHMYEPISALLHPAKGLLTNNSFFKDSDGNPITFPLIDGIFIVKHLHNFWNALLEKEIEPELKHPFQYRKGAPFHAFIQNPHGRKVPEEFIREYEGMPEILFNMFADYAITDVIFWVEY